MWAWLRRLLGLEKPSDYCTNFVDAHEVDELLSKYHLGSMPVWDNICVDPDYEQERPTVEKLKAAKAAADKILGRDPDAPITFPADIKVHPDGSKTLSCSFEIPLDTPNANGDILSSKGLSFSCGKGFNASVDCGEFSGDNYIVHGEPVAATGECDAHTDPLALDPRFSDGKYVDLISDISKQLSLINKPSNPESVIKEVEDQDPRQTVSPRWLQEDYDPLQRLDSARLAKEESLRQQEIDELNEEIKKHRDDAILPPLEEIKILEEPEDEEESGWPSVSVITKGRIVLQPNLTVKPGEIVFDEQGNVIGIAASYKDSDGYQMVDLDPSGVRPW